MVGTKVVQTKQVMHIAIPYIPIKRGVYAFEMGYFTKKLIIVEISNKYLMLS